MQYATIRGPFAHRGDGPMSSPRRVGNPTEQHAPVRLTLATPHPDVVAAAEFLLAEPDAYLYRRRYLELITHTPGPDGTTLTDYTVAEKYLLTTAARRREEHHRPSTLYAVQAPDQTTSAPPDHSATTSTPCKCGGHAAR